MRIEPEERTRLRWEIRVLKHALRALNQMIGREQIATRAVFSDDPRKGGT